MEVVNKRKKMFVQIVSKLKHALKRQLMHNFKI